MINHNESKPFNVIIQSTRITKVWAADAEEARALAGKPPECELSNVSYIAKVVALSDDYES